MDSEQKALSGLARNRPHNESNEIPEPGIRWRTRVLLPATIIVTSLLLLTYAARDTMAPATTVHVVPAVFKEQMSQSPAAVLVQAPGWVEPDPFAIAASALADGIVSEILVLEGDRLEENQIVAQLVPDDAQIALDQADAMLAVRRAELASAKARLNEAESNWNHPIELTRKFETSKAALTRARAELDQWPFDLAKEKAHEVYLELEYKRVEPLGRKGSAAEIEVVRARQSLESHRGLVESIRTRKPILEAHILALEAEVLAARENLNLRIEDTSALAEARAAVDGADAAIQSAKAIRKNAALRLERMKVRSPAAGIVMTRLAEPGSKLMLNMDDPQSAQVVRLYDPKRLQVRVDIPLADAASIGVGQEAEIIVDVLPDKTYRGFVSRIVHQADVQKNTLQVKVAIKDPTSELKPEMLARARFRAKIEASTSTAAGDGSQPLFVPRSAILQREGRESVWIADQVNDRARLQHVTTGDMTIDDWQIIVQGLRPGDRVITDPPSDLRSGDRIRMIER